MPTSQILTGGLGTFGSPSWIITGGLGDFGGDALAGDFIAAVVNRLRDYDLGGQTPAEAFGETLPATPKIFSDKAVGRRKPRLPYLVIGEPGGLREWYAGGGWIDRNQVMIGVYGKGKKSVRDLADKVARALNDAPLTFEGGELMRLHLRYDQANPQPAPAAGVPTAFARVLSLDYWVRGSL